MTSQSKAVPGPWLRHITGWALVAAAIGTFWDEIACGGCPEGSFGLVPLYLGFPIGAFGLALVFRKTVGMIPAVITGLGLAGILVFMGAYPDGADGWIGGVLIGIGHLFLPLSGRFAAVLWVASGVLGFPEFGAGSWGVIRAFSLFGAATAYSGAFVLWGRKWIEGNGYDKGANDDSTN